MICEKCGKTLVITRALVELVEGEGASEIEMEVCFNCKILWDISIAGYECYPL